MPARLSKTQLPSASKRKRFLHAFYLAQPFLQFFALMAVMVILSRCSPLASSVDRVYGPSAAFSHSNAASDNGQALAQEELVQKSLKEVSTTSELTAVSESAFSALTHGTLRSDTSADMGQVKGLFRMRAKVQDFRRPSMLVIDLSPDQRAKFFQEGIVRIDLAERLGRSMDAKTRSLFLQQLGEAQKSFDLSAHPFLITADDSMQNTPSKVELPSRQKISMAILSEEQAILELRRIEEPRTDAQQEQLRAFVSQARGMAVVLE